MEDQQNIVAELRRLTEATNQNNQILIDALAVNQQNVVAELRRLTETTNQNNLTLIEIANQNNQILIDALARDQNLRNEAILGEMQAANKKGNFPKPNMK